MMTSSVSRCAGKAYRTIYYDDPALRNASAAVCCRRSRPDRAEITGGFSPIPRAACGRGARPLACGRTGQRAAATGRSSVVQAPARWS